MDGPVKKVFKLNLIIMRLLGFYPPRNFKKLYLIYACAVYVCFTTGVPTLAAVHLIVGENITLTEVADNSFMICQVGCFIFKMIPFVFNVDDIRRTIFMLEQPLFNNYTKEQESIMQGGIKVCKRNTWLFLGFCAISFLFWATVPLFGNSRKFPMEIWLPFDATSDNKTFIFTFIYILLGVGNGAISNGVIDPLISGMACLAATEIRILKDNLERLLIDADEDIAKNIEPNMELQEQKDLKNKIIYEKIIKCVNHHNAILKFVDEYEKVYSPVLFTQFMAASLVICISTLRLSMVEPFTFTFFFMVLFLMTMLLEIFLFCYFGSSLFEESNSLTTAVYMGKWYEYDYRSRQALIVLMERSKRPMIVTAGKILELSLVTFTTILRRAYSLLAVLRNYQVDV